MQQNISKKVNLDFQTTEDIKNDFLRILKRLNLEKDDILNSLLSEWVKKRRNIIETKQKTMMECI